MTFLKSIIDKKLFQFCLLCYLSLFMPDLYAIEGHTVTETLEEGEDHLVLFYITQTGYDLEFLLNKPSGITASVNPPYSLGWMNNNPDFSELDETATGRFYNSFTGNEFIVDLFSENTYVDGLIYKGGEGEGEGDGGIPYKYLFKGTINLAAYMDPEQINIYIGEETTLYVKELSTDMPIAVNWELVQGTLEDVIIGSETKSSSTTFSASKPGEYKLKATRTYSGSEGEDVTTEYYVTIYVSEVSFNLNPIKVGIGSDRTSEKSLPNSTDKPYRLIATIEPIQSESLFSFISSDTSRVTVREVSRTNLSPSDTTQVILEVIGVSATPISSGSGGEELIKAKFESDEVEEAKVVVLVPYEVQEPNDNINHIADPVSKRAADGNSIPPVIGVPNGLVVLEYIWNNVITIQVLDQFGDNLSSIYTGSEVKEVFGGTPYKMNQKLNSNGTYSDPVIVYIEHSVVQKVVNNAPNPQISSFLTSPVPTNITFPTVNTTQNIGVEIDGILLNKGVVNRKVKTIQPNIINIDW